MVTSLGRWKTFKKGPFPLEVGSHVQEKLRGLENPVLASFYTRDIVLRTDLDLKTEVIFRGDAEE